MIMVPPVKPTSTASRRIRTQGADVPEPAERDARDEPQEAAVRRKAVQAVSYAVPYDAILENVMHGYAQKNRSIVGAGMLGSDFSSWHYNTDLKKAADKLKEAGFSGGAGAAPITITVRADWEEAERAAILIQANLQKIGLKVSVQKLAFAPFNEQEQGRRLQCWIDDGFRGSTTPGTT